MPITVVIDPTPRSNQAQVLVNATPFNDGVMSRAQAAKLASLNPSAGGGSFQIAIAQPADGSDFIVTLPSNLVQANGHYNVTPTIATANVFTGISVSYVDQTGTQFRVTTDGTLPAGTLINFAIQPL